MLVSLCSIAINFLLNYYFTFHLKLGHRGLALSTSLVAFSNFAMLYTMMRRYAGRLETGAMIRMLAKLSVAGGLLVGICLLAQNFIFSFHAGSNALRTAFGLLLTIGVGGAAFFGVAYLLHVAELRDVVELVRRKLRPL